VGNKGENMTVYQDCMIQDENDYLFQCEVKTQIKFPRSKKKRILKKWAKNKKNFSWVKIEHNFKARQGDNINITAEDLGLKVLPKGSSFLKCTCQQIN
jgi:hypothetical protein